MTTEYNPFISAADIANMQAGSSSSILDNITNYTGAALVSGFASIYNTAAYMVGADKFDTLKWIEENDASMGEYYRKNKDAVDLGGFIAGSIVPGGLALKGLQLAKAGTLAGPWGRALGVFSSRRDASLKLAIEELSQSGGTIFNQISRNKFAAMGWGIADNVLQMAAFETAVAATMHQSPLMEKDDLSTIVANIFKTSFAFGLLGGGIEALAINAAYKGASKTIEPAARIFDRLTILPETQVLPLGTRTYHLLESMLDIPKEGKNLEYWHKFLPTKDAMTLPTKEAFEKSRIAAVERGWNQVREFSVKLAGNDAVIGMQLSRFLESNIDSMQRAGKDIEEIKEFLQDHLMGVNRIKNITPQASKGISNIFYVAEKIPEEALITIKTGDDLLEYLVSRSPSKNMASETPYEIIGDKAAIRIALIGKEAPIEGQFARFVTPTDAWKEGFDAVIRANGTIAINPRSERIVHRADPIIRPTQYFNFPTGSYSFVAYPTIADLATSSRPLNLVGAKDTIVAGEYMRSMKQFDPFILSEMDTIDASARYAWVAMKDIRGERFIVKVPEKISATDLPMLDRIGQEGAANFKDVKIEFADGSIRKIGDLANYGDWLQAHKIEILKNHLANNGPEDLLSLSAKLNSEVSWIQKTIENNFLPTGISGWTRPLDRNLYPENIQVSWDFSGNIAVAKKLGVETPKNANKLMIQALPDGAGNQIYGILNTQYALKIAKEEGDNAVATVFGAEKFAQMPKMDGDWAKLADVRGAGPSLIGFTNADYGDYLRVGMQFQGQLSNLWIKEFSNNALAPFQPFLVKIRDDKVASAEWALLTNFLRRSADNWMIHPEDSSKIVNIRAIYRDPETNLKMVSATKVKEIEEAGEKAIIKIENEDVATVMNLFRDWNVSRLDRKGVLLSARGWESNWDKDVLRVPPVDTGRYPFFAFVRKREGTLGASSEVSMITARTEEQLRALAKEVPENYQVIFKSETKDWFKAKDAYDYELTIKEPVVNQELQRVGRLANFYPETRFENVVEDFVRYIQHQEAKIVRLGVEIKNDQLFAELRSLGKQFEQVATSKAVGDIKKFKSQVENPFNEYIKMALDISKRSEYTLLHELNEFTEGLGKTAYRMFGEGKEKALSKMISWEEANEMASKFGIRGPYSNADAYWTANTAAEKSLTKEFVSKANMFMVNFTLRLDWAQSLMNIISTPILLSTEMASIRKLVADDPALAGKIAELRSIKVPGEDFSVPSTMKLISTAIKNFWSVDKAQLLKRYHDLGAIKDVMSKYHEMIDDFSYKPWQKISELRASADAAIEKGAKWTGNLWAEEFTRFVSADVMRQVTEPIVAAGKMTLAEQNSYISIFVNRVQGNYLASQRPVAFQGVVGAAISLFQTYQFNLLQQLFRHVGDGNKKAYFTLLGMQGGLYGMNGIPLFEAMNNYLIGQSSMNPQHKDAYSYAANISTALFGNKDIGEWMMYGTASAFPFWSSSAPALYTRGDINPRHISIVPINPMQFVAVDGSIRFVKNLVNIGTKIPGGAAIGATLLEGLEHNGINRPLAGIAQAFNGRVTTSKGSLISSANDFNAIATMSRIIGSKPMDESLALNTFFRIQGYQAADQARLEELGEKIKSKLHNNKVPTTEELMKFQEEYAKAGGRIENYFAALQRWMKDANVSIVNQLIRQHQSSYSKRLMEIMGGTTLPDYRSNFAISIPPEEQETAK
jgi:hypothetical protein